MDTTGSSSKNGTVREFYIGVELEQANDNALRRLRIVDHRAPSIFLHESPGAVIEDNIVTGFSTGIFLSDGDVVRRNVITGNGGHGIEHGDSKLNRIEMNVVSRNNGDGIHGLGFDEMLVRHNLVTETAARELALRTAQADNRIEATGSGTTKAPESSWARELTGTMWKAIRCFATRGHGPLDDWKVGSWYSRATEAGSRHNRVAANGGRGGIVLSDLNRENVIRRKPGCRQHRRRNRARPTGQWTTT